MDFRNVKKRIFPFLLIFVFFFCLWILKELPLLVKEHQLQEYLILSTMYSFHYADALLVFPIYLPLYLLFEYLYWEERTQIVVRTGSRVRYLLLQTRSLFVSTLGFWLIFILIGVLPLLTLSGKGWGTFLFLFSLQTTAYFLISFFLGLIMYWLFQLFPHLHLAILIIISLSIIVYFATINVQNNLFITINLLQRHYFIHNLSTIPFGALLVLYLVSPIIICLRILLIQHEEFWQ